MMKLQQKIGDKFKFLCNLYTEMFMDANFPFVSLHRFLHN